MKIEIYGPPQAAQRCRVTKTHTYNPQRDYIDKISWEIKEQFKLEPLEGPLSLSLTFFMPIPIGYSIKKKRALIGEPHFKRPDLDNLVKLFCDAANNVLFCDDSQIFMFTSKKIYSEAPRTEAIIEKRDT